MAKIQRLFPSAFRRSASGISMAIAVLLSSLVFIAATQADASAFPTSGPISSLELSNSTITERNGTIYDFDATYVATDVTTTSLTATFASGTVGWVNGSNSGTLTSGTASSIALTRGNNDIALTHSLSGTDTTYHVYISRAGLFSNMQIMTSGVTLTPAWDPAIREYTLTNVPYSTAAIEYVVTESYNEPGHLECSQCDWWQYNSRGTQRMTLNTGANRIVWRHYPGPGYSNGLEEYTIEITRAGAFDSTHLTGLTLSNSTLTEQSGELYKFNGSTVAGENTGVTATFVAGTATWSSGPNSGSLTSGVAATVPLQPGGNTVTVTHSLNGTNTPYVITVARNGVFSNFQIMTPGVTLTPAWDPAISEYTLTNVPYSTNAIEYVVTESYNEPGHLECSQCDWWQYNSRGTQRMTLNTGENRIVWRHYPGPGYNNGLEEYTINVVRGALFDSSRFTNLTLSNSTLTEQSGQLYKFDATSIGSNSATTSVTATFNAGSATWTRGASSGSITSGTPAAIPLVRGNNTITIDYVRNGVTTTYTIYIARNGQFSNFELTNNSLTLTPAWDPSVRYYRISDVPLSTATISYTVTESYNEPGHLECSQCDWWQYNSRGPQQMTLNSGANCIRWSHYAGPGYSNDPEYYYIAVNRGANGRAPTGDCDPSTATTTTTTTSTTSTTSTSTTTTVPAGTSTTVVGGGSGNGSGGNGGDSTVTTIAQGQNAIATIAPSTSTTIASVSGANQSNGSTSTTTSTTTLPPEVVATDSASAPAPAVADIAIGSATMTVGGKTVNVNISRVDNQVVVTGGGVTMTMSVVSVNDERVALDSIGGLRFGSGDKVVMQAVGLAPGEEITLWAFSTPTSLGTVKADANGKIAGTFKMPSTLEKGDHRLVLQGLNSDGEKIVLGVGVGVGQVEKSSSLSRILIAVPIAMAVIFGVVLPTQARRRRRRTAAA